MAHKIYWLKNNIFQKMILPIVILILTTCFSLAQDRLVVRSGDHPTYSRLVFDWNSNVNYSAELIDNKLTVVFDRNAMPDFTSVLRDAPAYLSNPIYEMNGGNLEVTFDVNIDGRVRHFRSGSKVVVDLMNIDAASPVMPAVSSLPNEVEVVETAPTEPVRVLEAVVPSSNNSVSSNNNSIAGLPVEVSATNDVFTLKYLWDQPVRAAAFIRSNKLWVVFDKYITVNHTDLNTALDGRITSADQMVDQSPTILTYTIAPNQNVRMVKSGNSWEASLRSNFAVPQLPIEIGFQSAGENGASIFLIANELGEVITLEDPFVGDDIAIVTASQSSQGISDQSSYTEFNILKTAQGIALQLIADDIFVTGHDNGVAISGQNGLAVSKSSVPILREVAAVDADIEEQSGPQLLVDFEKWGAGPLAGETYTKNRHELLYQLSTATDDDRNEARWNLAVYDLANNNAAEAFGILQLMGEAEPGFIENPSYRAALAVSNIKMRRFDEAIELLNHRSLTAELDALLWRSLAYEATGNYEKALEDFNLGIDVLSLQSNDNKADFIFSSIRSAHMLQNIEYMSGQINGMNNIALDAKQLIELDYWRGKLAEGYGDDITAAEEYDKVIASGVRYPASLASFARINQQVRLKQIETMQAIDALEKLRFAWRGDDFELDLLKQLGEFYVDQNEYREGLSTLRQAATYFPRSQKTSELTRTMTDIYNDLFLNGGADSLSPLKAMALFLEFRELTPLGADGDTMGRNLARRMVSVDLLNDAAELLEYQIEYRLQGVARAIIASDLAKIYVLNKEPEKALQTLRSTRQAQVPDDIEAERRMIEIRSLVEIGNYEEAEVMLEGESGEVAENLKSDIYWKSEDWQRVVNHGYQALGDRWTDSAELNANERQSVLRIAVALALDENLNGLENLRSQYINHMENGMFADAFEIITAKEQKTGNDIRELTQTIASVDRLETFMDSYRDEFAVPTNLN